MKYYAYMSAIIGRVHKSDTATTNHRCRSPGFEFWRMKRVIVDFVKIFSIIAQNGRDGNITSSKRTRL